MWLVSCRAESGADGIGAVRLPEGDFVVGSGEDCDLVVQGRRVSRRHVMLRRSGESVSFEDLGSSVGTRVNGAVVKVGPLRPGDRITIDGTVLILASTLAEGRAAAAATPAPADQASHPVGAWDPFGAFFDKLRRSSHPRELLERLLLGLVEIFKAERGFVLLREAASHRLVPVASYSLADTDSFVAISSTIYRIALEGRSIVYIADTARDERCVDARSLAETQVGRTVVCGPLLSRGQTFGVIYIDLPAHPSGGVEPRIPLFETITGMASELLAAAQTRDHLLAARRHIHALSKLAWEDERLVLGDGPAARQLQDLLQAAAEQDVTVLLTGETGTGKEMVARALHRRSGRRDRPFVPVNCAALPADIIEAELFGAEKGAFTGAAERRLGRFELASPGTLFLDEIGELPPQIQVKLLRVLQERTVTRVGGAEPIPLDFRLVCATNADLEGLVRDGAFRRDLYYRINVFRIQLKPLRERPEDIRPLAEHFLAEFGSRFAKKIRGFSPEAESLILSHPWPGNVRELRNAVERAVVVERSDRIRPESLPIGAGTSLLESPGDGRAFVEGLSEEYEAARRVFDDAFFRRSLDRARGNIAAVARTTGLNRKTVYRKLTALGLLTE